MRFGQFVVLIMDKTSVSAYCPNISLGRYFIYTFLLRLANLLRSWQIVFLVLGCFVFGVRWIAGAEVEFFDLLVFILPITIVVLFFITLQSLFSYWLKDHRIEDEIISIDLKDKNLITESHTTIPIIEQGIFFVKFLNVVLACSDKMPASFPMFIISSTETAFIEKLKEMKIYYTFPKLPQKKRITMPTRKRRYRKSI